MPAATGRITFVRADTAFSVKRQLIWTDNIHYLLVRMKVIK